MFQEIQLLYIVTVMSVIEQMSFQPVSENRKRCGGSDVLGKLVPEERQVAGMASKDVAAVHGSFRRGTSATRRTSDEKCPGEQSRLTHWHWNISVASLGVIRSGTWSRWSWHKSLSLIEHVQNGWKGLSLHIVMNTTPSPVLLPRRCCGVSAILVPSRNVMNYLLTCLLLYKQHYSSAAPVTGVRWNRYSQNLLHCNRVKHKNRVSYTFK